MEDPVLDEAFMRRYRELLDAEDNAFDELEHAYEDGDRNHFETDFAAWNRIYAEYFPAPRPARTTLVTGFAVPGLRIEVQVTAGIPAAEP